MSPAPGPQRWFARCAAALVGYLLFVIVFGAWVRITGSGAGCGEHWPSCQGVLVPRTPSQATVIEYSHRLTSGLLGIASLALPIAALRLFPRGHGARRWSGAALFFVTVEAAIGALLVKQGLVADNASLARAVVVALHLVNTLLLTASAALTVASVGPAPERARLTLDWRSAAVLVGLGIVAASGAVTALGDTLFPVGSPQSLSDHFLVQLRVVHPILASALVLGAIGWARWMAGMSAARRWATAVGALAVLQLAVGGVNIVLRAPGALQLAHLLLAQLLWISAVLAARSFAHASARS
jgi:heme A synthase